MITPAPYSSLTTDQIERVEYLFADALFGTDPSAYRYEIQPDGSVTGRVRTEAGGRNRYAKRGSVVSLAVRPDPYPTRDQIRRRAGLADLLAANMERQNETAKICLPVD